MTDPPPDSNGHAAAPAKGGIARPPLGRGLSAKLLALTIAFVLIGEVLIYIPSIARFRESFLIARLGSAHLATMAVDLGTSPNLPVPLENALLEHSGVKAITLWRPHADVMLGRIGAVDRVYDLRDTTWWMLIMDAVETLRRGGQRTIRVVGPSPQYAPTLVDIVLDEDVLYAEMAEYSWRILALSVALSMIVGLLLFASLRRLIVRPLVRVSTELQLFREHPEDATADPPPSGRRDEIGVVERELGEMRQKVRQALQQKTRLAALGAAVSRINHDLKNLLALGVLLSERLDTSADPAVRKVAPRLIEAMERAARLCADTLSFAASRPAAPRPRRFRLRDLVDEVLVPDTAGGRTEINAVPAQIELMADSDQLYRVLLNLVRNAREAMGPAGGSIRIAATAESDGLVIDIADTGPGLAPAARQRLFEPFSATSKPDGSGLGLAIARELMAGQGGAIALLTSSSSGTTFRLRLPSRCVVERSKEKVE
ncbi:MAG: HAMP domain-containing sensor histidine kinase [Geminicoccaceae bacterium]